MRLLEIILVAMAGLYPLAGFVAPRRRWVHGLPIAAALLVIVHLILEGYRWQMVPVYVVVAIMARVGGRLLRKPAPGLQIGPSGRSKLGLLALIPVVLMALLPILVPVPKLPEPSGPFEIGTLSMYFVDEDRTEIYGPEPGGPRELMVQVWYPADPGPNAEPGSWSEDIDQIGPANAERLGFPPFVLDHLVLAKTHSYPDAPLSPAEERYPVILSSHGWTGFRTVNVDQSEALASHGYIVVSIDHTYGSIMTVLPDGRAIGVDDAALPEEDDVGPQAYQAAAQKLVEVYAADLAFVLDSLETLHEEDDRFAGRLDLERVGLFGHSTGGGAVVTTCHSDERCVAAAGLDAWVEPVARNIISDGLTQPFLSVRSEEWTSYDNDPLLIDLSVHGDGGQYLASIAGTQHWDFVAIPLLTPLAPQLGLKGPINSGRVMKINADLLVSFFDAYLKGGEAFDVGALGLEYPELRFEALSG